MKNKKVILSSILSLVLCLSLIAGGTFALFTSESKTNIAISSGKVEVVATVDALELYSPAEITRYDDDSVAITDSANAATATAFANGGTATLNENAIDIVNMTPGDKVNFNINLENKSNVAVKYQMVVAYESDAGLGSLLTYSIDGTTYSGNSVNGVQSDWTALYAGQVIGAPIAVEIELPIEVTDQNLSTKLFINVVAVQGNTKTEGTTVVPTEIYINTADDFNNFVASVVNGNDYDGKTLNLSTDLDIDTALIDTNGATSSFTIDGGGNTVTLETEEVTYLTSANNSTMVMENITITGVMPYLSVGNYVSGDAAQKAFSAELNDVTVTALKVDNFNNEGVTAAVICYGTAAINNCDLSGTTTDTDQVAFDLMALNNSTVTVSDGFVQSAVVRAKGSMIVKDAKIDTIVTGSHGANGQDGLVIESGSEIGTISCRIYGGSNDGSLYKGMAKITIKAGATVGTLDLTNVTVKNKVVIEDGATVNKILVDGVEMTFAEWQNS